MTNTAKPFTLIILDGWGYSPETEYNAIAKANTPNWDKFWQSYPHTLIEGSGNYVGLPDNQMGNSEVGHLNMGAGRVVYQELTKIDQAIADGDFAKNPTLNRALAEQQQNKRALHIIGLLSPGGVHSHENHIIALLELAAEKKLDQVYLHAILDGRDTPPKSAQNSLEKIERLFAKYNNGKIATLTGRYYAMDRDKRWQRTQLAYDLLTLGKCNIQANSATDGLAKAYARGETDEFVEPTVIGSPCPIQDGDTLIFMNYRADRARQLTHAFIDEHFLEFKREKVPKLSHFISLTRYAENLATEVIFPPCTLHNGLGEYIASLGLNQLRIAETEKYAHVTYFFNGGREQAFPHEDRILIPSAKVKTYDLKPEMSAFEITAELTKAISSQKYSLLVCNFANADMVGHTGNMPATIQAIETIDACLGKIYDSLKTVGGEMLITSDHGNAEYMYDETTKQAHTAHTSLPIPCVYIGKPAKSCKEKGCLADIAPTILNLLGLTKPKEMTGESLFCLE